MRAAVKSCRRSGWQAYIRGHEAVTSPRHRLTLRVAPPSVRGQMPLTIPSAAMRQMSESELARLVDSAFEWSADAVENYLAILDARLRAFEQRYEIATSQLDAALGAGTLRDTADVSEWLFWAHLRSDIARKARP